MNSAPARVRCADPPMTQGHPLIDIAPPQTGGLPVQKLGRIAIGPIPVTRPGFANPPDKRKWTDQDGPAPHDYKSLPRSEAKSPSNPKDARESASNTMAPSTQAVSRDSSITLTHSPAVLSEPVPVPRSKWITTNEPSGRRVDSPGDGEPAEHLGVRASALENLVDRGFRVGRASPAASSGDLSGPARGR